MISTCGVAPLWRGTYYTCDAFKIIKLENDSCSAKRRYTLARKIAKRSPSHKEVLMRFCFGPVHRLHNRAVSVCLVGQDVRRLWRHRGGMGVVPPRQTPPAAAGVDVYLGGRRAKRVAVVAPLRARHFSAMEYSLCLHGSEITDLVHFLPGSLPSPQAGARWWVTAARKHWPKHGCGSTISTQNGKNLAKQKKSAVHILVSSNHADPHLKEIPDWLGRPQNLTWAPLGHESCL